MPAIMKALRDVIDALSSREMTSEAPPFYAASVPLRRLGLQKDVAGTASPELFVIYSGIVKMYIKFCLTPAFFRYSPPDRF